MLDTYRFGNWKFAYRAGYCTVCEAETVAEGRRSLIVLHAYFIPLLPVGLHTTWICPHCACDINTRRPTHPGLLYFILALLVAMAAVAVVVSIVKREWQGGVIIVSMLVVPAAILISYVRNNRYGEYLENARSVEPLLGDVCPVCGDALQEGNPPRCLFCDVNVLTH